MSEPRKQAVITEEAPSAIGPYSQAVVVDGFVYTSGQVGFDPYTGQISADGIEAQTEQVMRNLKAVLAAAGCRMADVIKTTVFLKDMNDFAAMNAIYARHLSPEGVVPPARSTVEVARLPRDARVEIEVIARQ
ncbi:RidA family protein [Acidipila sp. EB88]|uniref:RidA family protein n=1 Tax=Acidipila sp. EB88 TaxID=2305226 RepID=UPI000F5E625C|nr:RidA family protein [Acidipila sp. EB88]RRA48525.1 RidA family protein [Acidipila sp. EB88]